MSDSEYLTVAFAYRKGTDEELDLWGTLENMGRGVALATSVNVDGEPEYTGTEVFWDECETVRTEDGDPVWLTRSGEEIPQSQIEWREE